MLLVVLCLVGSGYVVCMCLCLLRKVVNLRLSLRCWCRLFFSVFFVVMFVLVV